MATLSVTIIAKNEERNLATLSSVADVADEVIVTDTGSTDRTVDVARRHQARVLHFPWIDDFAAAHNFGMSHADCDWILMLDADEELLPERRRRANSVHDAGTSPGVLIAAAGPSSMSRGPITIPKCGKLGWSATARLDLAGQMPPSFLAAVGRIRVAFELGAVPIDHSTETLRIRHRSAAGKAAQGTPAP